MSEVPPVLIDPPWLRVAKDVAETDPVVIPGLTPPADRRVVWKDGERAEWAAIHSYGASDEDRWEEAVEEYVSGGMSYPPTQAALFARAPEHLVRPLLRDWRPDVTWDFAYSLKPIVARFETDARDTVFPLAKRNAYGTGAALLPFLDTEVARMMADWRHRLKSAQALTRSWFERHGTAAVPHLVPDALGRPRAARRGAGVALRLIASLHGHDAVVEAARTHGDAAAEAVADLLTSEDVVPDPKERPAPPPKVTWADPALLPRPVLRASGEPLPVAATGHLITLLAIPDRPHLQDVRGACTEESLAEFGRALFATWRSAGEPSRSTWVVTQLGLLGDDETVRRLTPVIRAWPGQSGHAKAVEGLRALAAIGTDVALIHLNGIARNVRYRGLREAAERTIGQIARERGLTADQLADRLVPDFGLDGGLVLDYGPRRFTVGFDEQLRPYVLDGDGRPRKDLPKPGAKDDPVLAPAAKKRFAALKKDVRTVAADQIRRLESAMVTGRRWTPAEFRSFFAGHPLMGHVARRLVWTSDEAGAFRVAEDRTLADAADDAVTLPESARVGIAHPLHLGEALKTWADLFADYEITQPFPQLGRPVHTLTDEERAGTRLARFEDVTVPFGVLLGLTRSGWERGAPQDAGIECWISRPVEGGDVVIDLDPGIPAGYPDLLPEQRLARVRLSAGRRFGDLDPVTASEVLADLTRLAGSSL
ncbi:DUF4132 domain-containing protein [Actinomadura sp. DC4]|uniref:DUF4132 domain-containing protein n=1 Tax=Actinomadura sp. DC4 TaxID=3055069 RepID=UPI0025B276ED|nr:DUF4132 domain-containing protein [Actinomadura sp. DC4]MDN3360034.1 DUF4132 domain-containing protein [Actinomadura sp. DC4]